MEKKKTGLEYELEQIPENMSAWRLRLDLAQERALAKIDARFRVGNIVFGVLTALILGTTIAFTAWERGRNSAIEAGHAHHNAQTGKFEWNRPCGEELPGK